MEGNSIDSIDSINSINSATGAPSALVNGHENSLSTEMEIEQDKMEQEEDEQEEGGAMSSGEEDHQNGDVDQGAESDDNDDDDDDELLDIDSNGNENGVYDEEDKEGEDEDDTESRSSPESGDSPLQQDQEEEEKEGGRGPGTRQRSGRVIRPPARNGEYQADFDTSFDGEAFDDSNMDGATLAAQAFFTAQLDAFVKRHQSADDAGPDFDISQWRVQVQTQLRGLSAGFVTVFYHRLTAPPRKFKSRVEVGMDQGVFPFVRTTRSMPRSLQHLVAEETRERALVSQRISAHEDPNDIEEFFLDPDTLLVHARPCPTQAVPKIFNAHCFPLVPNAKIRSDDEREADKEVRNTVPETIGDHHRSLAAIKAFGAQYGYAYGNTCIVDYGQIVPSGHFHNMDNLYPLGLKFVRQEHDTVADRVVDCVCEIDCFQHSNPDVHPLRNTTLDQLDATVRADLRPLFRVTVAWDAGYGKHAIRVYEGKTPQLAWQSVLLEQLGTPGHECSETSAKPLEEAMNERLTRIQTDEDLECVAPEPLQPMDEEERRLRAEVIELRRLHMRALSAGQEKGEMQAVMPRLALAHVDQFFDVGLLPLFEGLPGTEQCLGYVYLDNRYREPPKTVLLQNLSRMQTYMRTLDKVAASFAQERVTAMLNIKKEQKREAEELTKQQKKDEKRRKTERSQQMVERRLRARELEKAARLVRDEAARSLNSRRLQSKFRVELLAKEEEQLPELSEALAAVMREEESKDDNKDKDAEAKEKEREIEREKEREKMEEELAAEEDEEEEEEVVEDKTIPRFSRKPRDEESSVRLPFGAPISLPADTFGRAMELWQFLVTYADVLGVIAMPTEKHFETALSMCDPALLHLQGIMNRAQAQLLGPPRPRDEDEDEPVDDSVELADHPSRVKTRREAKDMLTKLALVLCEPLMPEYNRLLLIESAEPYLGGLALELNELTWKDIARVVLTSTLCRHSGLSDHEVMSCIRGRGHLTAPDVTDRRVLRLAKRRMWFRYSQHLYRNQPDTAAIITPQNRDTMNHDVYRQSMLMHNYIGLGADFSGGLVLRLTSPAVFEEDEVGTRPLALTVGGEDGTSTCPAHQPQLVGLWCQLYTQLRLFREDTPFASTWMALEVTTRLLECVLRQGRYNNLHLYAWKVLQLCRAPNARNHGQLYPQVVYRVLLLVVQRLLETATHGTDDNIRSVVQSVLDNVNLNPCRINASSTKSPVLGGSSMVDVANKKQKVFDRPSPLQLYRNRKQAQVCAPITEFVPDKKETLERKEADYEDAMDVDAEQDATTVKKIAEQKTSEEDEATENEASRLREEEHDRAALLLSAAEQRLYRALKHLMFHSHAANFNVPVDGDLVKGYYAFVRNPLCLFDILTHLLAGGYKGNLLAFYRDVVLVFQNALAFNEESTAIAQAAMKLQFVFDRLVYECVLTLESPLENLESCHTCAATYEGDEGSTVICDRCDGSYHVECLSPPLPAPPRGEWFCPNCVAERGPELVHPLRSAIVHDPLDQSGQSFFGRVVGIVPREGKRLEHALATTGGDDQCGDEDADALVSYMEYYVEFGYGEEDLELLLAKRHQATDRDGHGATRSGDDVKMLDVIGKGHQKASVWLLEDVLKYLYHAPDQPKSSSSAPSPELPVGYSHESYDQLAAVAACHQGWGDFQTTLPPCVEPAHSKTIQLLAEAEESDRLKMVLKGAAVVGPLTAHREFGSEDWVSVLLALAYKAGSIDNRFSDKGQATEKDIEGRYMELVRHLKQERQYPSLREFQRRQDVVAIGAQLLVAGEEEYLVEVEVEQSDEEGEEGSEEESDEEGDESEEESGEEESEGESDEEKEFGEEDSAPKKSKNVMADDLDMEDSDDDLWDESLEQAAKEGQLLSGDKGSDQSSVGAQNEGSDQEESDVEESEDDGLWDDDMELAAKEGQLLDANGEVRKKLTIFSWETQRRSRRKGIEDALLTLSVVQAVNQKLADDDIHHEDGDDPSSAADSSLTPSQLAPGGLLYPLVRQCIPRQGVNEDTDMDVWTPAFERRLETVTQEQLARHDKLSAPPSAVKIAENQQDTDAMDVDEQKSETEQESRDDGNDKESEVSKLCAWCAQTEEFACSQFVHGHTWSEWYAWKQCREERALARQAAVDHAATLELDRILSGEGPSEQYKDGKLTEAATTMVQVWLPVNKADADLVQREAAHSCTANMSECLLSPDATHAQGRVAPVEVSKEDDKVVLLPPPSVEIEVLKGSLIVHECCAEAMSAVRMSKYTTKLEAYQKAYRAQRRLMNSKVVKKSSMVQKRLEDALRQALNRKEGQYPEERTLADVLVGLGQGKVVSLGYDFSGHVYYAMAGSTALLVCRKQQPDYSPGENPVCEDSAPFSMVSMPDPLGSMMGGEIVRDDDIDKMQPALQWQVFHNREDINTITQQLSQDAAPEKSLRSALEILFLRKSQINDNDNDEEGEDEDEVASAAHSQASLSTLLAEHEDYQALLDGDVATLQLSGTPAPSPLLSAKSDVVNDSGVLGKRKTIDDSSSECPSSKIPSLAAAWHAPSAPPAGKAALTVGARVLCNGHDCLGNALLWDAKVLAVRLKGKPKGRSSITALAALDVSGPEENLYKVRFLGWGTEYDSWLPESELHAVSGLGRAKQSSLRAKAGKYSYALGEDIEMKASTPTTPWVPQILTTLTAHAYMAAPGRHNHKESRRASGLPIVFNPSRNTHVPRLSSSRRRPGDVDSEDDEDDGDLETADRGAATVEVVQLSVTDELSVLKAAMLLVQAALPLGAMDEAEDRWGRGPVSPVPYFETMALSDSTTGGGAANQGPAFFNVWRHAVMSASTPALLMECQLMLEYSVRTAWLKSTGAKLMTCLPSRSQAIRGPTLGLVATRLWSLDKAVRYDKIKKGEGILEDEDELRKEKKNKLKAKQASRRKQQQKEEHNKKRAQYRR